MSNFKSLASQEVLLLLHVSIVSSKEAKRTFLTPVSIWHLWDRWTLWSHCVKF